MSDLRTPDNSYKQAVRQQWQDVAEAWHAWMPVISKWLEPATNLMLDLAGIGLGSRVLDLAAGDGDQSIVAAKRAGPTGYVLAIDISPRLVAMAEDSAREAGLSNLEAKVMDAEVLNLPDASFDVVICRLGLTFFQDVQEALSEAFRVLKPQGRMAAIVFSIPRDNPFFSIPISIIRRRSQVSRVTCCQANPFSLGDQQLLEKAFRHVGFRKVKTQVVSAPLCLASASECVQFMRETSAVLKTLLHGYTRSFEREVWTDIEQKLRKYEKSGCFNSPCELLVIIGVR